MQFPAVKFVAYQLLTALHHRAVPPRLQAAIAHLQRAARGCEGKQARHGVAGAIEVSQLVSKHLSLIHI